LKISSRFKELLTLEYLILFGLFIASFALTFRFALSDIRVMVDRVVVDDAFYYFGVARNLATGRGFTFDGLNLTNGFQPLWQFLLVPFFFFIQTPVRAIRVIILFSGILHIIGGGLIFAIIKKLAGKWWGLLAAFIWLFSSNIFKVGISGMESSILGVTFLFFVLLALETIDKINRSEILLLWGFCLGLIALSRVETAFLVVLIGIYLFFVLKKEFKLPVKTILKSLGFFLLGFFSLFGPYIIWNLVYFKTLTPVSGQIKFFYAIGPEGVRNLFTISFLQKSWVNLKLYTKYVFDLVFGPFSKYIEKTLFERLNIALPYIYLNELLALSILLAAIVSAAKKQYFKIASKYRVFLGVLVIFAIIHFIAIATLLYNHILYAIWYFPVEFSVLIAIAVLTLKKIYVDWLIPAFAISAIPKTILALFVGFLVIFLNYQFSYTKNETLRPADPYLSATVRFYEASQWINANLPKDTRIGGFSAGILGFFSNPTVINLDGYINSKDYFEKLKKGQFKEYIEDEKIEYIADYFTYNPTEKGINWHGQLPPQQLKIIQNWKLPDDKVYYIIKYQQE